MTSVTVSDTEVSFVDSRRRRHWKATLWSASEQEALHDRVRLRAAASPASSEPGFCCGLAPFLWFRCYSIEILAPASRSLLPQIASPFRTALDRPVFWFPPHRSRRIGGHPAGSPKAPNQASAEPVRVRVSSTRGAARRPAGREALRERAALPWAAAGPWRASRPQARADRHWPETHAHRCEKAARRRRRAAASRQPSHRPSGRKPARHWFPFASSARLWTVRRTHRPAFQEIRAPKRRARFLPAPRVRRRREASRRRRACPWAAPIHRACASAPPRSAEFSPAAARCLPPPIPAPAPSHVPCLRFRIVSAVTI